MNGRQQVHLYIMKCSQNNKHCMNNAYEEYCLANNIKCHISKSSLNYSKLKTTVSNAFSFVRHRGFTLEDSRQT